MGTHLLGQVAGALRGVEDLVVEHREVEGQAQADGVGGGQVHQGDVLGGKQTVRDTGCKYEGWLCIALLSSCVPHNEDNVDGCGAVGACLEDAGGQRLAAPPICRHQV